MATKGTKKMTESEKRKEKQEAEREGRARRKKKHEEVGKKREEAKVAKKTEPSKPTPKKEPEPVRLNEPEPEKEKRSIVSEIIKPTAFRELEEKGRLQAGYMPVGFGGGGVAYKALLPTKTRMGMLKMAGKA